MPVPLDAAGAESPLSHMPVPAFFREAEQSFSLKRSGRPLSYTLPPQRPRHKSTLTVSRIFSSRQPQPWSQPRPLSVSFHGPPRQPLAPCSRLYDAARKEPFFRQRFQQLSRLGRGSFGEVYKVRCKEEGGLYAVKRSVEPFRGQGDRRRKLAEVWKHERVGQHPNCVRFVRAWEERGQLYIQTELCLSSLQQYCEGCGPLPEWQVRAFLWDLLQGLHHLHQRSLLHMDVKPANIFLSAWHGCKLGDFGLMLDLEQSGGDLSDAQEGDPRYMAPELLRGDYTKAADVFSLGMTILEIACNLELPNGGEGWQQLRQGQLPPEFTASLSPELRELLASMLDPDPRLRPSVEALLKSGVMRRTEKWRKMLLLAQVGLQRGLALWQGLLCFLRWLCGALCSPAGWWPSVPVTPPCSPLPLLLDSSLSSDWEEEEEEDTSLSEDAFDLSEGLRRENHTCPAKLQPQGKHRDSPQLSISLAIGSTSTPRHPSPHQTESRKKRTSALQGSLDLSHISRESPSRSARCSDSPSGGSLRHTLAFEDDGEDSEQEAAQPGSAQHSSFEPKNLLSMFEESLPITSAQL